MKLRKASFFFAALVLGVNQHIAIAQSQPATSYTFNNLTSGIQSIAPFGIRLYDFGWAMVNATTSTIVVTATLSQSGFQFAHPDGSGGLLCGPSNSYSEDFTLAPMQARVPNVLSQRLVASVGNIFQGTLTLTSDSGSFYVYSPNTLSVIGTDSGDGSTQTSKCNALYNAWEGTSWTMPWFWDSGRSVLISPYANEWKNDTFWDKGWNTSFSIQNNNASSDTTYTIHYVSEHNYGGTQGNGAGFDSGACSTAVLLNQSAQQQVNHGGNIWSGNLNDTILALSSGFTNFSTAKLGEDGFFWVELDPVISDAFPQSSLSARSSGSQNCGPICGIISSCHN
jgi:hypothetical protein